MSQTHNIDLALAFYILDELETPDNLILMLDDGAEWQQIESIDKAAVYMGEPTDQLRVLFRSGDTANYHFHTPALAILPTDFFILRNRMDEPLRWQLKGDGFYHATTGEVSCAAHNNAEGWEWDIIFADSTMAPIHSQTNHRHPWQAMSECGEAFYRLADEGAIE